MLDQKKKKQRYYFAKNIFQKKNLSNGREKKTFLKIILRKIFVNTIYKILKGFSAIIKKIYFKEIFTEF